jgi:hypothetical protein
MHKSAGIIYNTGFRERVFLKNFHAMIVPMLYISYNRKYVRPRISGLTYMKKCNSYR